MSATEPPPNYEQAFAAHPAVYEAWNALNNAIKAGMDLRRYELATIAAARAIRSTYCSLAHGTFLAERFGEPVARIVDDRRNAGLSELDIAIMDFAEHVAVDAASVTDSERAHLGELGLSEQAITDIALTAAARCFFAKTLDGLGVRADARFNLLDGELKAALVVGAPIAEA